MCIRDSYRGAVEKKYRVLPAWGVTDYSDISNVTVDDQKIDEVHELDAVSYTHLDVYKRQDRMSGLYILL